MPVASLISVTEYLESSYRPDCDYIEGELVERNVGELSHGRLQARIIMWFGAREQQWRIEVVPELRLQVSAQRFRVPDVMIVSRDAPVEQVVVTVPLLCIEILSPRDTLTGLWGRIQDYLSMGVPTCWVIDPGTGQGWIATRAGLVEAEDQFMISGEFRMPLAEVLE